MKSLILSFLFCAAFAAVVAFAAIGGDISAGYGETDMACLRKAGFDFIIVRCFHSTGTLDTKAPASLAAAKAAGIPRRDVYHFPCKGKISVAKQLNESYAQVKGQFDTMWLDIEANADPSCAWSKNYTENCNFLADLVQTGERMGIKMGAYASHRTWGNILVGCTAASHLPLWYAHYDGKQSFEDWVPYGGWTKPTIKQINDHIESCPHMGVDNDWWPTLDAELAAMKGEARLH